VEFVKCLDSRNLNIKVDIPLQATTEICELDETRSSPEYP